MKSHRVVFVAILLLSCEFFSEIVTPTATVSFTPTVTPTQVVSVAPTPSVTPISTPVKPTATEVPSPTPTEDKFICDRICENR